VLVDREQDTETEEWQSGRFTQQLHSSVSVEVAFSLIKPISKECSQLQKNKKKNK